MYQTEIAKGTPTSKAESLAMKAVCPEDPNRSKTLRRWKAKGLWPVETRHETVSLILDPETLAVLPEIARWWLDKGRVARIAEQITYRPSFRGQRVNSSIRINAALQKAALKKSRQPQERGKTGGNFSGLLEWLLWGYLEFDPAFVESETE